MEKIIYYHTTSGIDISVPDHFKTLIRSLASHQENIISIKLLRSHFDLSLSDAKELHDFIAAEEP